MSFDPDADVKHDYWVELAVVVLAVSAALGVLFLFMESV